MKNSALKTTLLYLMASPHTARPRLWVRWFVNPWFARRGRGSIVRSSARMDLFPNHRFELGRRSVVESFATVNNGVGDVIIGNNSRIGIGCTVIGPITVGSDVHFAQNIVASGLNHNYADPTRTIHEQGVVVQPIVIEDDVWIGANVFLAAGITVGRHSVVAAGAVVTHSVPEFSIVAGNPARVIKQYNPQTNVWDKV